jgi:excisionase family DNA binding protein
MVTTDAAVEWRPVSGYEGLYEVSSDGWVRRAADGQGTPGAGYVLTPWIRSRYPCVSLYRAGRRCKRSVHLLVAAAFLGPCPPGLQCNHKDGDTANSRAANLEYVTPAENGRHAVRLGLRGKARPPVQVRRPVQPARPRPTPPAPVRRIDDSLTEQEVAAYLQVHVQTVRRWRRAGTGPPWRQIGRGIRYRPAEVDRWIDDGGQQRAG